MWESLFTAAANSTSASTFTTVLAGNMSSFVIPFGGSTCRIFYGIRIEKDHQMGFD
jgi:hypothetical protein